jgi:hypothetical protein
MNKSQQRQQTYTSRTEVRPTRFWIRSFSSEKIGQPVQNCCCNMRGQSEEWATSPRLGLVSRSLAFGVSFRQCPANVKALRISHSTIKEILSRQLGLRQFSQSSVLEQVLDNQKSPRARDSRALLAILLRLQDNSFE